MGKYGCRDSVSDDDIILDFRPALDLSGIME